VRFDLPVLASWDGFAFALAAVALVLSFARNWSPLRVLGLCGLVGVVDAVVKLAT
jgi:hypothetical protein